MHKRIVEAIEQVIKGHEGFEDDIKITIYPQETGGFWTMKIVSRRKKTVYALKHIEHLSIAIGRFYSEGLGTELKKRTLHIS